MKVLRIFVHLGIVSPWNNVGLRSERRESKCRVIYAKICIDSDQLLMVTLFHLSSSFFVNTLFSIAKQTCLHGVFVHRLRIQGEPRRPMFNFKLFHLFWKCQLCMATARLTGSYSECISLGLSFFLGFQQTWWRADLRPQAGSTSIINTKDGYSTGKLSRGWILICASRIRAMYISSKWNQERLFTQYGKKLPGEKGTKS